MAAHEDGDSVRDAPVDVVVKLGGSLLAHPAHFQAALAAIGEAATLRRVLLVPGGGPFADAVRDVDRRLGVGDEAAHWMAVLAMDQHAHAIVARLTGSVLVTAPDDIRAAVAGGRLPVLAPSRWLRDADPLPHGWHVTSDSIAAWVAGAVGARRLVLVKPPDVAPAAGVVDAYFSRALPRGVVPVVVTADRIAGLRSAIDGS